MADKQPSFSIDDFIGEIEKAEDAQLNKRLPQERLKNKRALDNAARRSAEAQGLGDGRLKPQPLAKEEKAKKSAKSPVTGMTLKSPKSKANSAPTPAAVAPAAMSTPMSMSAMSAPMSVSAMSTPMSMAATAVPTVSATAAMSAASDQIIFVCIDVIF